MREGEAEAAALARPRPLGPNRLLEAVQRTLAEAAELLEAYFWETTMEWEEVVKRARVLIVDDDPAHVRMLERTFEAVGYLGVTGVTDPREVPGLYLDQRPDLILLDLHMPRMDGYEVMTNLAPWWGPCRSS